MQRELGPVLVLEGGDSLMKDVKGESEEAGLGQRRAKARLIAESWVESGLDAAALGSLDWKLGTSFIVQLAKASGYPATAANLVCEDGRRPFPAARVFERGGRTIAVVGVTTGEVEGCTTTDPMQSAKRALALADGYEPDVRVLLWPDRNEGARQGVAEGDFDFVIDATGRHAKQDDPTWGGGGWVLGAGAQTKALGVLSLEFSGGSGFFPPEYEALLQKQETRLVDRKTRLEGLVKTQPHRADGYTRQIEGYQSQLDAIRTRREALNGGPHHTLRLQELKLTADVADHPETLAKVAKVKEGFSALNEETTAALMARPMRAPQGSPYAGTEACVRCHAPQYNQWKSTGHARAMPGLVNADRHRDDDCIACHVTGASPAAASGFPVVVSAAADVGGLLNVQCEACHGPGAAHVADPGVMPPVASPTEATCRGCHTPEQDEGRFDWATYLPKISHPNP